MDPLLDAARRFAAYEEDGASAPGSPHLSRTREEHAKIIGRTGSLTAIDAGSALIARRSNAAFGVVKTVSLLATHPGFTFEDRRWIVSVASERNYMVRMVCVETGEEREAILAASHAGVLRDPDSGIDLARALLERDLQSRARGLVLADGSLAARIPEERAVCERIPESVLGIVKRPSLVRPRAPEMIAQRFAEPVFAHRIDDAWYCRLHPASALIVRIEGVLDEDRFDALLLACSDAAIPGYPYALVLADRFARISTREARSLALESAARFGLAVGSLHDVLDSLER